MPDLSCSVVTCVYNKTQRCAKGDIKVEGNLAKVTEETCCASFRPQDGNSMTNKVGDPKVHANVACDAAKCVYNENHICKAEHIGIVGQNADASGQTECSTFKLSQHAKKTAAFAGADIEQVRKKQPF